MERAFKIIFPITLILGLGLLFFDNIRWIGIAVLAFFQPLILLYYLTFFKRTLVNQNIIYRFKTPFLFFLIITLTLIPLAVLFRLIYWPLFGSFIVITSYISGFIALVFAGIYLVLNRKILKRIVYEFIVLFIPIMALLFNVLNIHTVKKEDYEKDIHENYFSLNQLKQGLMNQNQFSNSRTDSLFTELEKAKKNLIEYSGGRNENGIIRGWMDKSRPENQLKYSGVIDKLLISDLVTDYNKNNLREAKTVMNFLIVFTNIQNELLLKENKNWIQSCK